MTALAGWVMHAIKQGISCCHKRPAAQIAAATCTASAGRNSQTGAHPWHVKAPPIGLLDDRTVTKGSPLFFTVPQVLTIMVPPLRVALAVNLQAPGRRGRLGLSLVEA